MTDRIDEARKRVVDALRKVRATITEPDPPVRYFGHEADLDRALADLDGLEEPLGYEVTAFLVETGRPADGIDFIRLQGQDLKGNAVEVRVDSRAFRDFGKLSFKSTFSVKITEISKG